MEFHSHAYEEAYGMFYIYVLIFHLKISLDDKILQ